MAHKQGNTVNWWTTHICQDFLQATNC